jgi:hypothetical protein
MANQETENEIAGSVIGGAVSASSSGQDSALFGNTSQLGAPGRVGRNATSPLCPTLKHAACTSGQTIELNYQGCTTAAGGEIWTGVDQYQFTSGACTITPEQSQVTFVRSFPSGMIDSNSAGRTIASYTSGASGWEFSVAGAGTTVTIDPASGLRSIQINGVHMVATQSNNVGDHRQTALLWDHTISMSEPLYFDSVHRTISSGTMIIQHNLRLYTDTVRITAPLQFQDGVCNPVSGTITATSEGSQTGTQTLTYIGNNQAVFTDSDGNQSTITLTHCF